MAWKSISASHWQRPLGENERMIKWIGDRALPAGREHWSVTAVGTFAVSSGSEPLASADLASRLRRAWALLRFQHPSIAAVAGPDTLDYFVPDAAALAQWADETLTVLATDTSASDVIARLQPSPYATGFFLPRTSQFVLHTSHWRTDGYGILHLLDAFFGAVASDTDTTILAWGDETARLAPSIEHVLRLPAQPTAAVTAETAACLATGRHIANSVGLPPKATATADTRPSGTRSVRHSIPADATSALLAACRAHDILPLAAAHAALAAANLATSPDGTHYTSTMRFSLRAHLPPPYDGAAGAAGLYTGGYMARADRGEPWAAHAAMYDGLYRAGVSDGFVQARREYAVQALRVVSQGAGLLRSEVDMSSVEDVDGIVEMRHGTGVGTGTGTGGVCVEVRDVSLGVECLAREAYLFYWIFRGKMEFDLVYNEAFYEGLFMEGFLDVLVGELKKGLGVE
ncbi:hypothetical protein B0T26DRAFT_677877 [Lasiosphaeria miniovina]|uniref:Uncharacterized protein n=1 Tax=Lasiosphaeria miniovina TaxID=1954250 RepID=A0AA40AD95_9PEZI|nr:uncharacterized protein B0T26DRAFT_677877 [Lasiosphaeria miniovina]KAK0713563.1 hypothetical protein B0T26DRAFT_677877 [Lasiosphaeria miniovina]